MVRIAGFTSRFHLDKQVAARLLLTLMMACMPFGLAPQSATASFTIPAHSQSTLLRAPLSFVPNAGQSDPRVAFQASSPGANLFFTANQVVIVLSQPGQAAAIPASLAEFQTGSSAPGTQSSSKTGSRLGVVRISFENANNAPQISGLQAQPGRVNYINGNDPAKWVTNLPTYAGILYQGLYPGIDLRYETVSGTAGQPGALKGTYRVAPGADPGRIRWRYAGATVQVDAQGNLQIAYPGAANGPVNGPSPAQPEQTRLVEQTPVSWQEIGQNKAPVKARYSLNADGSLSFVLPEGYDRSQPLVLDPTLVYSTFVGGASEDNGSGIAVDSSGIYFSGLTFSTNYPVTGTIVQGDNAGGADAYVTKLNPSGSALIYSTYLGGSGSDYGLGFAVDSDGDAYVTGLTDSTDFPFSSGAYDKTCGQVITCTVGVYDAFVTRLNPSGSSPIYSTYLGGDALDIGYGIAVDNSGDAFVVGRSDSTNFPTSGAAYQTTNAGVTNGFVTKLDTDQSGAASLIYSTYLGGNGVDRLYGVALDSSSNAYVVGRSSSTNFPMAGTPFQTTNAGGIDGVVSELNDGGSELLYSTYLGGSGDEAGFSIAIDTSKKVYITGSTTSANFPTSSNTFDTTCGSDGTCNGGLLMDGFVAKLDPAAAGAASRVYATYFGGKSDDAGQGIAVDSSGNAYVAGYTDSTDLPVLNAFQPTCGAGCEDGYIDAFVTRFNANGNGLIYSTYLGGSSSDYAIAITLNSSGIPYVTGDAHSYDFPVPNAYNSVWSGDYDTFVAKIDNSTNAADLSVTKTSPSQSALLYYPLTYTITISNSSLIAASGLRLLDSMPQGVSFISATPSQGSCQPVYNFVTAVSCSMNDLGHNSQATVKIQVNPYQTGTITNTVSVSSNLSDPSTANNTASATNVINSFGVFLPVIRK